MAKRPTPKKAKAKSAPKSAPSQEESVIIDGTAEEVTSQDKKNATGEAKPKADQAKSKDAQAKNSPPNKSPSKKSQKIPLSLFAMLMAVMALGLAGWAVMIGQKNIDPQWRGDLTSRVTNLETGLKTATQNPPSFDDGHLAQQENLEALAKKITTINDRITALSAEFESKIAAANTPSSDAVTPAQPSNITDETITAMAAHLNRLHQDITRLQAEIEALKTVQDDHIKAQHSPAPQSASQANNQPQGEAVENQSWWQSLFGSIRISRLPEHSASDQSEGK